MRCLPRQEGAAQRAQLLFNELAPNYSRRPSADHPVARGPEQQGTERQTPGAEGRHRPCDAQHLLHLIVAAMGLDPGSADTRLAEARIRTADIAENLKAQADAYLSALQEAPLPPAIEEVAA